MIQEHPQLLYFVLRSLGSWVSEAFLQKADEVVSFTLKFSDCKALHSLNRPRRRRFLGIISNFQARPFSYFDPKIESVRSILEILSGF